MKTDPVPDLVSTYQSAKEGDLWLLGRRRALRGGVLAGHDPANGRLADREDQSVTARAPRRAASHSRGPTG